MKTLLATLLARLCEPEPEPEPEPEQTLLWNKALLFLGTSHNLERFFSNKIFQHSCIRLSTSTPSFNNNCIVSLYS